MVKRTRPGRGEEGRRPDRTTKPLKVLNAPYPGCCTPYPDATFRDQTLVKLNAHHRGPHCGGYLEPMDMEGFLADIDGRRRGGDE